MNIDSLSEIAGYNAYDSTEEGYKQRFFELISTHGRPWDRTGYDPGHLTASTFVVSQATGNILLVHHRKLDRWLQPGGHIDDADISPVAAAARELLEETGLASPSPLTLFDLDIQDIPARKDEPSHLHFDVRYLAVLESDLAGTLQEAESHSIRWFSLDELQAMPVDSGMIRAASKLLAGTHLR